MNERFPKIVEKTSGRSAPAFVCRRCGQCCRGQGGVWLTEEELPSVSRFLALSLAELKFRHLAKKGEVWEIVSSAEDFCSFYDLDSGCLIEPVKPVVCRAWPFFWGPLRDDEGFKEARAVCPGLEIFDFRSFSAAAAEAGQARPPKNFKTRPKKG
ncbi:MAG: YkgJ family cysteine cluster protein [Deltaproteobacteria bacterium]|jgi:Fe-S-cluster containining protein|nr:YkgJ family cysteine cluster protein [Deltaproteobacteria bacterium]